MKQTTHQEDIKLLILFQGINGNTAGADVIAQEIEKHVDVLEYVHDYTLLRTIPEFAAETTSGLIRKHKATKVSIVGYSLGGMVAQEAAIYLATTQPHIHIDCVILIATTAPISSQETNDTHSPDALIIGRALEVLSQSPPNIKHILQQEMSSFENPRLDKLLQQYMHLLDSPTTVRLLKVAAEWILRRTHSSSSRPRAAHSLATTKIIILVPEFDELFPAAVHTDRIRKHLEQRSGVTEFEHVKLERSNHEGVTSHRDARMGGEYIGKCGNLGLVGKLRFLLNYKHTEVGIAVAALVVVLTILLVVALKKAR